MDQQEPQKKEPTPQEQVETAKVQSENKARGNKPYSMEPNMEAAFSYLISPLTGVLVYYLEKDNKFVRFHAFQSILFGVVAFAALSISDSLIAVFIGLLLVPLVSITVFILWLLLMWRAYNKEEFELPFLGQFARDQVNKETPKGTEQE